MDKHLLEITTIQMLLEVTLVHKPLNQIKEEHSGKVDSVSSLDSLVVLLDLVTLLVQYLEPLSHLHFLSQSTRIRV